MFGSWQRDHVAAADAKPEQGIGEPLRFLPEFAIAQPAGGADHRLAVAVVRGCGKAYLVSA